LLIPVFVFGMVILTLGMSMLFGAMNVQYRDVKYVLPFLLQIWLFCTPIIYPASVIPERFRPLLALNPCWGIIEGFRTCIFPNRPFDAGLIGTSVAITLMVFFGGALYFRQTERRFADII
jgi:lipopolysaccharide transport system permease protein